MISSSVLASLKLSAFLSKYLQAQNVPCKEEYISMRISNHKKKLVLKLVIDFILFMHGLEYGQIIVWRCE